MHDAVWAFLVFMLLLRSAADALATTTLREPLGGESQSDVPACTVEQLLPVQAPDDGQTEGGWVMHTGEARPSYDCSCAYFKARQVCDMHAYRVHVQYSSPGKDTSRHLPAPSKKIKSSNNRRVYCCVSILGRRVFELFLKDPGP